MMKGFQNSYINREGIEYNARGVQMEFGWMEIKRVNLGAVESD